MLNIRLATLDDVEILGRMYQDFYASLQSDDLAPETACKIPKSIINSEDRDIMIAEINGNIAGFIHVAEWEMIRQKMVEKYAVYVDLYVSPDYSDKKIEIGKSLINAINDWAKERNLEYLDYAKRKKLLKRKMPLSIIKPGKTCMWDILRAKQSFAEGFHIHLSKSNDILRQIAVLRWGNDENKLDSWINTLRSEPPGVPSFYVLRYKDVWKKQTGKKVIGCAYFWQDETNENHWYCNDLIVAAKYRRLFIAAKMFEMAMCELKVQKASKIFTYIDKADKSSIKLHEKLSFIPSEKQENINGFDKNNRIVYERIL